MGFTVISTNDMVRVQKPSNVIVEREQVRTGCKLEKLPDDVIRTKAFNAVANYELNSTQIEIMRQLKTRRNKVAFEWNMPIAGPVQLRGIDVKALVDDLITRGFLHKPELEKPVMRPDDHIRVHTSDLGLTVLGILDGKTSDPGQELAGLALRQ